MAVHFVRDIETDDEGEFAIERGDFKIAGTERTAMQLVNWVLLTDFADYTPRPNLGSNLVEFIGFPNTTRTHRMMRQSIRDAFRTQGNFAVGDVRIAVEPTSITEAGVLVHILGDFFLDVDEESIAPVILAFRFPFPNGQLVKADLGSD
jgi:hypothetical protein